MDIPYFADLELVAADIDPRSRGRVTNQRWPGVYNLQLFLPDSGPLHFQRNREEESLFQSPHLYWHEPRHSYTFGPPQAGGAWHHCWISLRGHRAQRLILEGFNVVSPNGYCPVHHPQAILALFQRVCQTQLNQADLATTIDQILLLACQPAAPNAFDHLMRRIQKTPCSDIDPAAEAQRLGIGIGHFRRRFRQHCGMALHEFVLTCRMDHAARLLTTRRDPIATIAAELGYSNASQFSKLFRSRLGCSPRVFRQMLPRASHQ